jgi:hypothetical protein
VAWEERTDPSGPSGPSGRPRFDWRRLTRSPRGAAGLAILAAALLLWPFSGFSWIPLLIALGALVLLRVLLGLLRLHRALRGWDVHLAGLVVVAGLMTSTGPWAWGFAASIGVLLAGLVQLPRWRLAAAGAVLCVISGAGFGYARYADHAELVQRQAEASRQTFALMGERRPERVLGALLEGIGQGDVLGVCALLDDRARQDFVTAAGAADCASAVAAFRATDAAPLPDDRDVVAVQEADRWLVDGCSTPWATLAGTGVGRIEVRRSAPPGGTYFVSAFLPCNAPPP